MLNSCTFAGRLASDIDLRYTPNGKAVANFRLAITRPIPDQNGERPADFIQCVVWSKTAENMANILSSGDTIGFDARVQTRSYENDAGKRIFVTEFVVHGFPTFFKVKKWNENNNDNNSSNNSNNNFNSNNNNNNKNSNTGSNHDPFSDGGDVDLDDDNLPF
ncbi:single-stranded DNA-binding protein [Halobacillus locisalis]|uniref:Single-stranded DNA-binding protein n=1 Tax=Halobacillus locisalis TaxID=220753 RepID=A0A838CY31_9BACI|nr:single-stranded DNA-binding protein [Halobacillus locisalis]MBA2176841.1 single-stranded DNA-binding protein [Halobacillus locisalis]